MGPNYNLVTTFSVPSVFAAVLMVLAVKVVGLVQPPPVLVHFSAQDNPMFDK